MSDHGIGATGAKSQDELDGSVTMDHLVLDLLGLDPAVLARFGEANDAVDHSDQRARHQGATSRRGLNLLLRRALALTLDLRDDHGAVVRLKSAETARANGWPDAQTANVAMMLTWALMEDDRQFKGLPSVPLLAATGPGSRVLDPSSAGVPSAADLVARFGAPVCIGPEWGARREDSLASPPATAVGTPVASTNQAIEDILRLRPRTLASVLDRYDRHPEGSYVVDPERAGRAGLSRLVRDVMRQYETMTLRRVDEIRLMTDEDAEVGCRPDARSANFATLLSAGLLSEDGNEPTFQPPRPSSAEHERVVWSVAKYVYFEGSEQSLRALQLLCDGNVQFGCDAGLDQASRLLARVHQELDADGERFAKLPAAIQGRVSINLSHQRHSSARGA